MQLTGKRITISSIPITKLFYSNYWEFPTDFSSTTLECIENDPYGDWMKRLKTVPMKNTDSLFNGSCDSIVFNNASLIDLDQVTVQSFLGWIVATRNKNIWCWWIYQEKFTQYKIKMLIYSMNKKLYCKPT